MLRAGPAALVAGHDQAGPERLGQEGISTAVVNARFVKPLDHELIVSVAKRVRYVVTIEEGCKMGGFGSTVLETLSDAGVTGVKTKVLGLPDWYIEQVKPRLYGDLPGGDVARAVVAQTFEVALRLLHPVMPFITEALWRRFPGRPESASISVAPWPGVDSRARDPEALTQFGLVQELVSAIRAIRAEYGSTPFANGCLMARRLVESGVRFVQVFPGAGNPWGDNTLTPLLVPDPTGGV